MAVRLGLFPNPEKRKVLSVLDSLLDFCREQAIEVCLPQALAKEKNCQGFDVKCPESIKQLDVAVSLGGDGTFLHMTQDVAQYDIPVCGINMGRKGFLTEIEVPNMKRDLLKICAGQYEIEARNMLQVSLWRENKKIREASALNDIVLTKGNQMRIIRLAVNINGSKKDSYYSADGIVFATATGSTAYSLSAGGPLVHPSLPVTIITPICPHSLATRPLVVPENTEIQIKPLKPYSEIILANDGLTLAEVLPDDLVKVSTSSRKSRFIRFDRSSYYDTWQQRLQKGETV